MLFLSGEGCKQSSATALYWFREAAKNGDVTGFSNLMRVLWDGWGDIQADRREAIRCYRTAPKDTRAAALLRRARSYDFESDGSPDYEKAFKWYKKAAALGIPYAQYCVGHCYAKGEGVPKDDVAAARWYHKSALQRPPGFSVAQHALGICYRSGIGVPQDFAKAAFWLTKGGRTGTCGCSI
jgi:TPR repeat protein